MDQPKSRLAPALIVAGILCLVMVATYVAGYFYCSTAGTSNGIKDRCFEQQWQITLYGPAARVESAALGMPVQLWVDFGLPPPDVP